MECSTGRFWWVAVVLAVSMISGCVTDNTGRSDGSCVLNTDCGDKEICASDGTCVALNDQTCAEEADCSDIPAPTCSGDQLTTYGAVCDGEDVLTCKYPAVETVTCEAGCSEGACNPNPCEGVVCDDPPAPHCDEEQGLVTYEQAGTCSGGECSYDPASPAESCVHGCEDGACKLGPCEEDACDTPPAPSCDGNVGRVFSDTGTCTEENGSASCSYDITFNNCDYVGGTCDDATGTCVDLIAQVGGVSIVEVMANPIGRYETGTEWFEVVNTSGAAIDLSGWKLQSGTSTGTVEEHVFDTPPSFDDGARLVLASGSDPAGDQSVTPDYVYADVTLNNTSDWIQLVNASDEVVDYVYWEPGTMIDGSARKLDPSATDNDDFASWCPELDSGFGADGNLGTPGAVNPSCVSDPCATFSCSRPDDFCTDEGDAVQYTAETATCEVSRFNNPYCDFEPTPVDCAEGSEYCVSGACEAVSGLPSAGDIVITELMGNPSSTDDGDGEYIELYNTTDQALSLFTLVVKDSETGASADTFTVEDPAASIPANGYAVLAANTDSAQNGGIDGAYLLADSPLKNSPGASGLVISVELQDGTVIDQAYYGEPAAGASQQLSLDAYTGGATNIGASNDDSARFCTATVADSAYTSGDLGSPGADNEYCLQ